MAEAAGGMDSGMAAHRTPAWRYWWNVIRRTVMAVFDMDTSLRCAGVAFFGFLSLFPAIATIVLMFGLMADRNDLVTLIDNVEYILPNVALDIVREQLSMLLRQPAATLGWGLLISVVVALWSGSRGINALLFAMSRVRSDKETRSFVMTVVISVALTLAGSLFLLIALSAVAGIPALVQHFPVSERASRLLLLARWPFMLVVTVAVMCFLYRYAPDRHPRKARYIWPGAVLGSLVWVLAGVVFSLYVENFGHYEASFGSVSAAVALLLWMYNSAQVFVLGAAFNTQLEYEDTAQRTGHLPKEAATATGATDEALEAAGAARSSSA